MRVDVDRIYIFGVKYAGRNRSPSTRTLHIIIGKICLAQIFEHEAWTITMFSIVVAYLRGLYRSKYLYKS